MTFTATVAVVAPGVGQPGSAACSSTSTARPSGMAVPLVGNTATLSHLATSAPATTTIDATYNGNADFASSSSAVLTHGVNQAETAVAPQHVRGQRRRR